MEAHIGQMQSEQEKQTNLDDTQGAKGCEAQTTGLQQI